MKVDYTSTGATHTTSFVSIPERDSKEPFAEYLGRIISFMRGSYGITQKQLADFTGVTQPYISRFENGDWQSIKLACRLFSTFGLKLDIDFVPEEAYRNGIKNI